MQPCGVQVRAFGNEEGRRTESVVTKFCQLSTEPGATSYKNEQYKQFFTLRVTLD